MKTVRPSEEASSRTLRHTGVRGVGGEVKRKAVEIKDIWRAGWLAGFGWLWLWWAADKLAAPPDGILKQSRGTEAKERAISSCSTCSSSSTSDQRAYCGDTDTDTQ